MPVIHMLISGLQMISERKQNIVPSSEIDKIKTVNDVAIQLKVTPQYIRRLINEGKLKGNRVGNQWLITTNDVESYIQDYSVLVEPDDHPRRSATTPEITALSFFSGAMGLDLGMSRGGITALLACEFNKYCRMTINANCPDLGLIGDINKYDAKEILEFAKIPEGHKVDVIFGGPPCQAFSTAGARRALDDERGNVFLRYIDIIEEIHPTYIVIENVRGLLSAPYPYGTSMTPVKGGALRIILDRLKASGYTVSFELYNAANFGAPQIRERIVMIGKLGMERVDYLSPTHSDDASFGLAPWVTLGEALEGMEESNPHYIPFPEKRLKFYRMLKEGQYWKDLPPEAQQEAMGRAYETSGGKTGFYRRLSFDKPSPTLVTNPAMPATDLCHPIEDRPLSVEEYRRIQGFPDSWIICGPVLEQYKQIGNAVPIKLGEAIARTILADMAGEKLPRIPDFPFSRYRNTNDVIWEASMENILNKKKTEDGQLYLAL